MGESFGSIQDLTVEDIRQHPEKLIDLVLASKDRSIVLERRADVIHITYLKPYSSSARVLVAEAREEYLAKQQASYPREQAILDLLEAQHEVATQIKKSSHE